MSMEIWLPAAMSIIGVLIGAIVTHLSNDRIQKRFMIEKLNIDKKTEALKVILDTNRIIAKQQFVIIDYKKGRITHDEFLYEENTIQGEITDIQRELIPYKPFLSSSINEGLRKYQDHFWHILCDKIYDIYRDPKDRNVKYYKEHEHPYFEEDFKYVQLGLVGVCDELSEGIKKDYERLANVKKKDRTKLNLFKQQ